MNSKISSWDTFRVMFNAMDQTGQQAIWHALPLLIFETYAAIDSIANESILVVQVAKISPNFSTFITTTPNFEFFNWILVFFVIFVDLCWFRFALFSFHLARRHRDAPIPTLLQTNSKWPATVTPAAGIDKPFPSSIKSLKPYNF